MNWYKLRTTMFVIGGLIVPGGLAFMTLYVYWKGREEEQVLRALEAAHKEIPND